MPKIQQSEVRKKDFYVVRENKSDNVKRVIFPNGVQLGVTGFEQDKVPLKLTSGSLKNTVESGGIEYNGTDIFYTTDELDRRNITAKPYASYYSLQNQTNSPLGTEDIFTYDNTSYESYFSLSGGTKIYAQYTAIYNVAYSIQFSNGDSAEHVVRVWLKKNGVNVAATRSDTTVLKKQGGQNGHAILAANFFMRIESGHYIELAWSAANVLLFAETLAEGIGPVTPASPSVVITIRRVD